MGADAGISRVFRLWYLLQRPGLILILINQQLVRGWKNFPPLDEYEIAARLLAFLLVNSSLIRSAMIHM
jgi:hypothetical protein